MATFPVPQTRDDDPERAVQTALAIKELAGRRRREVELRIAVTTGEALVTDGVRVAGDPVAACARLSEPPPAALCWCQGDRPGHRALDQLQAGQPARPGRAGPADQRVERARAPQPHRPGQPGRRAGAAHRP